MATIQGYRIIGRFTIQGACGHVTTLKYARSHNGLCKGCAQSEGGESGPILNRPNRLGERVASREEQHARYLDCGPANWDDR